MAGKNGKAAPRTPDDRIDEIVDLLHDHGIHVPSDSKAEKPEKPAAAPGWGDDAA